MRKVSDVTDAERWVDESALKERSGERVAGELADSEIPKTATAVSSAIRLRSRSAPDVISTTLPIAS
jgi:hypothetical protein